MALLRWAATSAAQTGAERTPQTVVLLGTTMTSQKGGHQSDEAVLVRRLEPSLAGVQPESLTTRPR